MDSPNHSLITVLKVAKGGKQGSLRALSRFSSHNTITYQPLSTPPARRVSVKPGMPRGSCPSIEIQRACLPMSHTSQSSVSKSPKLPSPPSHEILGRHVNAQVFQCLGTEVTIVRPLDTCIRVVPFRVGLDPVDGQSVDLCK